MKTMEVSLNISFSLIVDLNSKVFVNKTFACASSVECIISNSDFSTEYLQEDNTEKKKVVIGYGCSWSLCYGRVE